MAERTDVGEGVIRSRTLGWAMAGAFLLAAFSAACGPADDSPPLQAYSYTTSYTASTSAWTGSGSTGTAVPPAVVVVDTDRTLTATGGQGVGVFTEYTEGGHWHVWWTCDTSISGTGAPCYFEVTAGVSSGTISNVAGEGPDVQFPSPGSFTQVLATSTTRTAVDGMNFDTAPGQEVQVDVRLNGVRDGRVFFFVQDGKVNGGYAGTLSDPIVYVGSTP